MKTSAKIIAAFELSIWAIWLGALWFMALVVAPGVFKWLARPEAGLVAARLFYMLSILSAIAPLLLMFLVWLRANIARDIHYALVLLFLLSLAMLELLVLHPEMRALHQLTLQSLANVEETKRQFMWLHACSNVVFAIKMIVLLVWGVRRYTNPQQHI